MATNGSITTNSSYSRSLTFNWWVNRQDIAGNYTDIGWNLVGSGGDSNSYVVSGNFNVWVAGSNLYSSSNRINLYNGTVVASGTHRLYHDNNGNCNFDAYIEAGIWTVAVNCTASGSWSLPQIPRYATSKQTLSSKTETSITMNWSSDNTVDYIWYSKDNGSTWTGINVTDGKSGTYEITGLKANTTYNIKTRVRRKDSQLTTDSSKLAVTTYDYPHCTVTPDFNVGEELTLELYNPLSRLVDISFIGANGETLSTDSTALTTVTGYNTERFVTKLYASIPNSNEGNYKISVVYEGITKTTDNGNVYKLDVTQCKPSFNNFTYKDTNTSIVNVTGNDQVLVKGLSNLQVAISSANKMTTQKSATPNKYIASIDTLNATANYSDNDVVLDIGTVLNAGTKRLTVTAYDSRNNDKAAYKDITVYDYIKPIINVDVTRLNNFEAQTTLKINGTYTRLTIDDTDKNSIVSVQYRYREKDDTWSEWITANTTLTSGKFTCNDIILSLDNTKEFEFEVKATDKLDSDVATGSIDVGEAIFFISSNKKACYINGQKIIMYDVVEEW